MTAEPRVGALSRGREAITPASSATGARFGAQCSANRADETSSPQIPAKTERRPSPGTKLVLVSRPYLQLPSGLASGFTAGEARRYGVHTDRLAQADVTRIAHGLYMRSSALVPNDYSAHPEQLWRERQFAAARAIATSLSPHLFFSGRTAAAIWGLPVRSSGSDDLEVSTFFPRRAPRRTGLRGTQVRPELVRVVAHRGLPVTDPASTWASLAGRLALPDSVALGDAVIRRARIPGTSRLEYPPLATLADLECVVCSGRRIGVARLRTALPLLSPHSASPPETHLRLLLPEWRLPEPELDFDVYDDRGRLIGCSELAFPEFRLALEYESRDHMTNTRQWNRDLEKYHDYVSAGWEPFRVSAQALYRGRERLRRKLHMALLRRGWDGSLH